MNAERGTRNAELGMRNSELAATVKQLAAEIGYVDCGLCGVEPFEEYRRAIESRVQRFPEAAFLYERFQGRWDIPSRAPWAKTLVVCVRWYGKYRFPPGLANYIGRNYLGDRRIAACPDHTMPKRFRDRLKELGLRAKSVPCPDRWAGARSGVTRFGRNGFAYSETHGSWINLETWCVDADLPHDEPALEPACVPGCHACLDACPTGALVEPFCMRMDRCVARLTYHDPEPVSKELCDRMGGWIYGCDVCQNVCPLNKGKWQEREGTPWLEAEADRLTPAALAEMSQETYEQIVHPLFWYIPKDNLDRWHRNARRALDEEPPSTRAATEEAL